MAAVALAIELNNLNRVGTQAQKAADAAALAGAVFMPDNGDGDAAEMATDIAAQNGFEDGVDGVTVTAEEGARPNQLVVTVSKTVANVTGEVLGPSYKVVTKRATAEYERATKLGGPINQIGNDPESGGAPGSTTYPNIWANIAGPQSYKGKGDGIHASNCAQSPTPDNCVGGASSDYDPDGYFLGVEVPDSAEGETAPTTIPGTATRRATCRVRRVWPPDSTR
jgi:hypothetical protein